MGRKRRKTEVHKTLCWDCENAVEPEICPWCGSGSPVPGWVATPTLLKCNHVAKHKDSFFVTYCPLFKRDATRGGMKPWKEGDPL